MMTNIFSSKFGVCVFYDSVQVNGYTFDLNRKEYDDKALLNTLKRIL